VGEISPSLSGIDFDVGNEGREKGGTCRHGSNKPYPRTLLYI